MEGFVAKAQLESITAYSQSKRVNIVKRDDQDHDAAESEHWREKIHRNKDGFVIIPGNQFMECLKNVDRFVKQKISGGRGASYGKYLATGVQVLNGIALPYKWDEVEGEWLNMDSNGKKGSGTRVPRCFPLIPQWEGEVTYFIKPGATMPADVFRRYLDGCGLLVGIGRWRPERGGSYGMFRVVDMSWASCTMDDVVVAMTAAVL